jgi:hypothetical protein
MRHIKVAEAKLPLLARLPRDPALVLAGGLLSLGHWGAGEPMLALWLDADTGCVRSLVVSAADCGPDDCVGMALEALAEACLHPADTPADVLSSRPRSVCLLPRLPGRVQVNHPTLAEAARALLAPLGVAVEHAEILPIFDQACARVCAVVGVS